ncbi:Beta-hexosaminidase [Magnetospirillum gryphiswaldense MSR-1 v2]|uniref:beta-N-acetylhexosaminidase n=1 Tax=Magnetospirillum gryphiswaldense (strain DSM 6361 / JCM 21280 / NBRC 15271 / MSR-1) TaxID=431944 RepID=V6EYC6_MAGGM|nr:beta-N-acetylhexosaminidase [Magnetospirillum gryphiswaldense]CDK98255.1 Beta-hexosaminidase [Magnetospirillum gryphiswaldense MSR-1 v2]
MSANNPIPAAAIFGCAGLTLSEDERRFFARVNPLGFILFARNVDTPDQVRDLVRQLRDSVGRDDAPVLIDQEGGRVQRLRPPHWRKAPPGADFARLAERDRDAAIHALHLNYRLIGQELAELGIDVDCAPVLDVPIPGAHDVIGDRAFGLTADMVADLGRAVCDGLLDQGVLPVIKHIPGHGRAMVDSHLALPVVETSRAQLEAQDFPPFIALSDQPWAMTAHVVYGALDADAPATTSAKVIGEIIRGVIGFEGFLISDDLSMKALGGDFASRTTASLEAGCDAVLHCNGDMAEMQAIAAAVSPLSEIARERLARGQRLKRQAVALNKDEAAAEIARLLT